MIHVLGGRTPIIASSAWVAPRATVIGSCELHEDSSVWFGAVLRGDNERITVGTRSNVQDGCVLHTDIGFPLVIGDNCTIGHNAILHGCVLGAGTLIGMGAIVLNGAEIGEGSLIGAGAIVTEGRKVPAGSLVVGAPGRLVRELGAEERARLLTSAEGYVSKARWYRDALRQQDGGTSPSVASDGNPSATRT